MAPFLATLTWMHHKNKQKVDQVPLLQRLPLWHYIVRKLTHFCGGLTHLEKKFGKSRENSGNHAKNSGNHLQLWHKTCLQFKRPYRIIGCLHLSQTCKIGLTTCKKKNGKSHENSGNHEKIREITRKFGKS